MLNEKTSNEMLPGTRMLSMSGSYLLRRQKKIFVSRGVEFVDLIHPFTASNHALKRTR